MNMYRAGIVAIAKDENPYLLEWLAYHLAIGFEHIWVYDNESAVPLTRVISRWAAREHVTIRRWPNAADGRTQIAAYNDFLNRYGHRVAWAAVIDLDEMICLKADRTIADFLERFDSATGIALNWRFFGSAGHQAHTPGLMMERFRKAAPSEHEINEGVKSLHKLDTVAFLMPHHAVYRDRELILSASGARLPNDWRAPLDPANFAIAQVNHYFVKSTEEWSTKIRRHKNYSSDNRDNYFERMDRNEVDEFSILIHLNATKAWMRRLERRPSLTATLLDLIVSAACLVNYAVAQRFSVWAKLSSPFRIKKI